MNTIPYDTPEQDWDTYEGEGDEPLSLAPRPRHRFWGPGTAALLALLVGAIGFYAGVRVEKGQISNSSSTTGGAALARALSSGGAAGSGTAARSGGGGGGFRALAAAGGLGGGNTSLGTVSTVHGQTLYVTNTSGNTVKVTLSSATKISKSVGVGKAALRPGDTVVVQGLKSSDGTIQATSLNDTGAGALGGFGGGSGLAGGGSGAGGGRAGTGAGAGSPAGGSGGANSAVNSLFGGG